MNVSSKLEELGLSLPAAPGLGGIYSQVREFGEKMCCVSGCGPNIDGKTAFAGKLGGAYTLEEGREAARMAALNTLAVIQKNLGSLDRVKRVVKLLCFVASEEDFYQQPQVADAASQLFADVFGEEAGKGARSAIGVNVLPGNIPFEIEVMLELY